MSTSQGSGSVRIARLLMERLHGRVSQPDAFEIAESMWHGGVEWILEQPSDWGHLFPPKVTKIPSESPQDLKHFEARLDELRESMQAAIDIGLENRKLLEKLQEREIRIGLGAIHSLGHGKVQLTHPLLYSSQTVDDEVVVAIEELGVYGVGSTEEEAVREMQEELWNLFQDLDRTPSEKLGPHLARTLRVLRARTGQNAVDA